MRIPFDTNIEITDSKNLFGRRTTLAQLISLANRRSCVQLIGIRRFGKTSILKCLEHHFNCEQDSTIYPIYFDFKEVGDQIKGTSNVYRYLVSLAVSKLTSDKIFQQEEDFRNIRIKPSVYWEDIFEDLKTVENVRMPGLFEEIITFFSDLIGKTFLCLFDEYEYLFRNSFDSPTGFMKLRSFSSRRTPKGLNPFFFFVAGGLTWDKLCSITGSGELNCIDTMVRVTPIDFSEFEKMWDFETSFTDQMPDGIIINKQEIYDQCGGVPFYAKVIGTSLLLGETKPTHLNLKSHLQEVVSSLEHEERDVMTALHKGPQELSETMHVFELRDSGLIKREGKIYSIAIGFLKSYLNSLVDTKKNVQTPQTFELTDSISGLIQSINETHKNKRGCYIFQPVNDDLALMKDLQICCNTALLFSNFANSLYRIVFEKTKKGNVPKASLPTQIRNSQFIAIVDIMRHSLGKGHLMDTFTHRKGQMKKEDMLKILTGSKNDPNSEQEFLNLQLASLNMFVKELNNLNTIVRNLT